MKSAINLYLSALFLFVVGCKTAPSPSSSVSSENSSKAEVSKCVIKPHDFVVPRRPPGFMGKFPASVGERWVFVADPESEDRTWMSQIIDAITDLGMKKCGCRLNALAFVHRTSNPSKYRGQNINKLDTVDISGLRGLVFKNSYIADQNGSGDVGQSKVYIHLFERGTFTWPGESGTHNWQFNDYENKTFKNGASVEFQPVEKCVL